MKITYYLIGLLGISLCGVHCEDRNTLYDVITNENTKGRKEVYDEHDKPTPVDKEWYEPAGDALEYRLSNDIGNTITANSTKMPMTVEEKQNKIIDILTHQLRFTQLAMEEKVRSDGDSGIKQIRVLFTGNRPYHTGHHSGYAFAAIHEHVDNRITCGSGEFVTVLNGIEFRTRHNDFQLRQPHPTSSDYDATQEITFPDVPPSVLQQPTVNGQIREMREWFKAFATQDHSIRDYRDYFKPVLCYLEGAWIKTGEEMEEPFYSDRHFVDASTWEDLEQKVVFTSHTGRKDLKENFAHLPTKIVDIKNGCPVIAQWNYRIICHALRGDLPTKKLHPVDDLAPRFAENQNFEEYVNSRAARFELHNDVYSYDVGLLDKIMSEIPGKDNYGGYIEDNAFDLKGFDKMSEEKKPINAAYYHRFFFNDKKGAMGSVDQSRGFSDRNLFVAMTTQKKVYGSKVRDCDTEEEEQSGTCDEYEQRMSFAIPFELIYVTPLTKWNPLNIQYKGEYNSEWGKTIKNNGRNGGKTPETAFNGTNSWYYYMTPAEFFASDAMLEGEPADTAKDSFGILDKNGRVQMMRPSGHHVFLPKLDGIGKIRMRYPIAPVHGEGSGVWKELEALKDAVMEMKKYAHLYRSPPCACNSTANYSAQEEERTHVTLKTSVSHGGGVGRHTHRVILSIEDYLRLKTNPGTGLNLATTQGAGHVHRLHIRYEESRDYFVIVECDGKRMCFDRHDPELFE